ncbi:hypothetical protein HMI54_008553 [Coelomomyces lativittatus]|nr:hypothetical protein HMI56_003150 [Coelomomyces lativittatus]KAJ1502906.1 hypothetical protein HMI54_008553 [Coelomomyces lativittatus]KAJ1506053.1 hypothetical protein HMI55_001343 [Coelomomyces lativittatus]
MSPFTSFTTNVSCSTYASRCSKGFSHTIDLIFNNGFHSSVYITLWIFFSSAVILYNKYILSNLNFPFPIFLTTWHLLCATVLTRILNTYTSLLPMAKQNTMSWTQWIQSIVPIGMFFSGSLIFYNVAYLTLTVSFIQMLKATTPIVVLFFSFALGLKEWSRALVLNVSGVVVGVMLASVGEFQFVWSGFLSQCLGIFFEAARLVLVQQLIQEKMDPLSSLYYFAPVCAMLNGFAFWMVEASTLTWTHVTQVGISQFILNALVAFLLNVSVVVLIGCTSSLVLTLSGVLKDILLVALSTLLFHSITTPLQMGGYALALVFLIRYKTMQMDWKKEYYALIGKRQDSRIEIVSASGV